MRGLRVPAATSQRLLGALVAALLAALALAAAPAAHAAATWAEIDNVPGRIVDVDADRILFEPDDQHLSIKDRNTQVVTPIPVGTHYPRFEAFLAPHGAIWRSDGIYQWRDDTGLATALPTKPVLGDLSVAGSWAIFTYQDATDSTTQHVVRRDLENGINLEVTSAARRDASVGPTNDVAANGDVVYWSGDHVYRFRGGLSTQLTPDRPLLPPDNDPVPLYPRTDGTNVLWRVFRYTVPDAGLAAFFPTSAPKTPTMLDNFTSRQSAWTSRVEDVYQENNGYIAYTKGGDNAEVVWVRAPNGVETALTGPGLYDIFGLSASGEVMYGRVNLCCGAGSAGYARLRRAGQPEVDLGSPMAEYGFERGTGFYVFPSGDDWFAASNGSLRRLIASDDPKNGSETVIDSAPQGADNPPDASFTFHSTVANATFQCRLDSGDWETCSSGKSYSGLQHGQHTFVVRSVEPGGDVDPVPAVHAWSVESTPPAAFGLLSPADDDATNDSTPTFSWQAASDPSGIDHYELWLDGVLWATDIHATSFTLTTPLSDSTTPWRIDAVDGAGNVRASASRTIRIDTTPPSAAVGTSFLRVLTGDPVELQSASFDPREGKVVRHQWDVDGDGDFDRESGAAKTVDVSYANPGDYSPRVRVTDEAGNTSVAVAQFPLRVRLRPPPGEPGISINGGDRYTNDRHVTVDVVWPPFSDAVRLSNDGGFADAQRFALRREIAWTLEPGRGDLTGRTVYARFPGSDGGLTYTDDITLDQTIPVLRQASVASKVLTVKASDTISGLSKMQLARDRKHPRSWVDFKHRKTLSGAPPLWVRVRDRAGNRSAWRATVRG
jgi:hypothetical protein